MTKIQYAASPSPPQDKYRSQVEHKLFNLILDMSVKGRDEFRRGMASAVMEWIEAGVLRGQRATSLEDITSEDHIQGDCRLTRLQLCELQETRMSLEIVRRLQYLVQTDGSSKRTRGSIGIDLVSGDWLNLGTQIKFTCFLSRITNY